MGIEADTKLIYNQPVIFFLPKISRDIRITPISTKVKQKVPTGYKLELLVQEEVTRQGNLNKNLRLPVVDFRSELQEILTLMVKESSIDSLSTSVIINEFPGGSFGIIVQVTVLEQSLSILTQIELSKQTSVENCSTDFKFITKRLELNKILVALMRSTILVITSLLYHNIYLLFF
jgi:hypothetical protein